MKFKQFINEAAVGERPKYESHEMEKAVDLFFTHCKQSMIMIKTNKTLYRGDKRLILDKVATVDPTLTERKSQGGANHYTVLLDNLPSWDNYPKRSRSFICSTDAKYAASFNDNDAPFHIIPFDNVKMGVCPEKDIWDVEIFNSSTTLGKLPKMLNQLGMKWDVTWTDFIKFDNDIKNDDDWEDIASEAFDYLELDFDIKTILQFKNNFLDMLDNYLDPDMLGFEELDTRGTIPNRRAGSEVWVGGKLMIIPDELWKDFKKAVLERADK